MTFEVPEQCARVRRRDVAYIRDIAGRTEGKDEEGYTYPKGPYGNKYFFFPPSHGRTFILI